ncbi:armadillo-type protein [Zopfochytrium polystomum]|nr:armadillo-type protein [Zopfochytrium polystomum]
MTKSLKQGTMAQNSFLYSLQRDVNILAEVTSDRGSKRRALEKIQRETVSRGVSGLNPQLATVLLQDLAKTLLRCFADPFEKSRELAIKIIAGFTPLVSDIIPSLPYTLPVLSLRLAQPDIVEPSEELRLLLIITLVELVEKAGPYFAPGVDETAKILHKTLQDPFADVKKESCRLIIVLCNHCPEQVKHHVQPLCKSLSGSLLHRHSAVRVLSIKALQSLALVDAGSAFHEDAGTISNLRSLTLDKAPAVREQLYSTLTTWLLQLPDRYSLGYKILPFIFSGLSDEVEKLATACWVHLDNIGKLYEEEWESRVKDELDLTTGVNNANLQPHRPRVGARRLTQDNVQKIVNKLLEGMQDWSPDLRAKSTATLASFLVFAEENITGYIGTILPVLYKLASADDAIVIIEILKCAETLGRFVKPSLYTSILLSHLANQSESTSAARIGLLRILHRLLFGTAAALIFVTDTERNTKTPAHSVASALVSVSSDSHVGVLREVALTALVLAEKMEEVSVQTYDAGGAATQAGGMAVDSASIGKRAVGEEGYLLFATLVTLSSVPGDEKLPGWTELQSFTSSAFSLLSHSHGHESGSSALIPMYFDTLLGQLRQNISDWGRFSSEVRVLDALLDRAGELVGTRLKEVVSVVIEAAGQDDKDIEVRAAVLETLLKLLNRPNDPLNSANTLSEFSSHLVDGVLLPTATWKPGRKLSRLRLLSIQSLVRLLEGPHREGHFESNGIGWIPSSTVESWLAESHRYLPVTLGALDEDEISLRMAGLTALRLLLEGCCARPTVRMHAFNFKQIYPELLKRLDDAADDVRVAACTVVISMTRAIAVWHIQMDAHCHSGIRGPEEAAVDGDSVPDAYVETRLDNVHWSAMLRGVVVHTDDSNPMVQDAALNAVQAVCKMAPVEAVHTIDVSLYRNVNQLRVVMGMI